MDFSAWSPGEPSEGHATGGAAGGKAAAEGEDAVHLVFVQGAAVGNSRTHWDDEQGSWNDNHVNGQHGHNEDVAFGYFPLCQTSPAAPPTPGAAGSAAKAWVTKSNTESCDGK